MKSLITIFALLLSFNSFAKKHDVLPTVSKVEVERYVGKWYAITALPQFFTLNCKAQTAEYEVQSPSEVSVLNTCITKRSERTIEGQAEVEDKTTNARLTVTFNNFWTKLFKVKGDYNIIELDENYDYVMVGSNNRKSLWIMSRDTQMPKEVLNKYIKRANELGFNTKKLVLSKF